MSTSQKTKIRRKNKSRPNKTNLKKQSKRIQQVAHTLRRLQATTDAE